MASLHFITQETKILLRWLLMAILGIIAIIILFHIGLQVKNYFFPTPITPPQSGFGKLPPIPFPSQKLPYHFSYTIDTISGVLPVFSDRKPVIKIDQPSPNLLNLANAQQRVSHTEFQDSPEQISDTQYQWSTTFPLEKKLLYNIVTQNFTLTSSYQDNATIAAHIISADQNTLIQEAKTFIDTLSLFPSDVDDTKTRVSGYTLLNNLLTPIRDASKAQVVRIDFFQKDIHNLPIYYPNPFYSPMHILIGETDQEEVVEASYIHHLMTTEESTYGIKTAQQAISDLEEGKAYIASYPTNTTKIIIHDLSLGYFVSDQPQSYLMPIVVIKGDHNFIAYVSAITDAWVQK